MNKKIILALFSSSLMFCGCQRIELEHYHFYNPQSQIWQWGYDQNGFPNSATVSITCENKDGKCGELTKVLNAVITDKYIDEPNCFEGGIHRYIAEATYENVTYTKSIDFATEKAGHIFENYYIEKAGHSKECNLCGSLEGPLQPHEFGLEDEGYYTCAVCGYVDDDRKQEYNAKEKINEIDDLISELLIIEDIMPYHEQLIRDIDSKYNDLSDNLKSKVENYDSFIAFKNTYNSKYLVIFDDTITMSGISKNEDPQILDPVYDKDIKAQKNKTSDYGYGFNIEVINPSVDNYLRYNVSTPTTYKEDDELTAVFYTHNIPNDITIRFVDAVNSNSIVIGGSDNEDLGDGWIKRTLHTDRTANLLRYNYTYLNYYFYKDGNLVQLDEGKYFISCLYGIKPNLPNSGSHYLAHASTSDATGNLEFWKFDGKEKIYLENPKPSAAWSEITEAPILDISHPAYIAKKGTILVDTINSTNWTSKTYDAGDNKNKFTTGHTGSSTDGGLYADFSTYQWTDWRSEKVGVDASYTIANEEMKYVNSFTMTYYSYQPVTPVNVVFELIDQNGNGTIILQKEVGHCDGPITETFAFEGRNFKTLSIKARAFSEGKNGYSRFLMKDVSFTCNDPIEPGNVEISTTDKSLWTCSAKETTNKIMVGVGSWWDPTSNPEGTGQYLALRAYQWTDWNPTQPGLTATYLNANAKIVNKLQFKYFINAESFIAKQFSMKIYIAHGGTSTLIDTINLNIDTVTTGVDIEYSKEFDQLEFSILKFEITTNEPKGTSGNSCIFIKDMAAKYVE